MRDSFHCGFGRSQNRRQWYQNATACAIPSLNARGVRKTQAAGHLFMDKPRRVCFAKAYIIGSEPEEVAMLNARFKRWVSALILLVLAFSMFAGCGDDDGTTCCESKPPEIPPLSTFLMDFSDFPSTSEAWASLAGVEGVEGATTKHNWTQAAARIFIWNTLITVGLAVPLASFIEAFDHEPVRQTDETWVWSYNFYVSGILHLAQLHGKVEEDAVTWKMYISKQGAYSEFLWYEGESNLTGTQGTWTLNSNPDDPYPLVGILWHRNPDAGTADIKYTNIVPDGPENGGYIFYGITTEVPYDAFYDIYNRGVNNYTDIEWDRTSKAGRISDLAHYGDTDWHCWDGNLDDYDCN
jgi:hypothetical protein